MGAHAVRGILGDRVADLILAHVPAKRYLVATRPEYAALLSPDSVMTLAAQGGPMSDHEVAAFEAGDDVWAKVELRVADDGAKVPGRVVSPLATYEDELRSLAASFTGR
jgi:predicted HD phosphohydrolase